MKTRIIHTDRIKQFLHAFLFCFFIFITACVIGGCAKCPPITFSSVLDIQADESGARTMSVTANKKTLQKLFHNSNFSFQSFITANCPKGLEWNYVDTASAYELTFVLSFDSLDEYQEKIDALTGIEQFSSISRPQVGVKTGFTKRIIHTDRIKQFLHAFLFCFFIFITACMMSGCAKCPPITFSSVLDIQADESGTRTMSVTANKKTLQKLFHNSNFSFQSFITANCPKNLEWNYVDTASAYELTFVLSFDSLDEYQEKIDALTGIEQFSSISRPQVGVKTGFTLSEPDDVMAVFAWFTDALKERTGLSDSKLLAYLSQQENELIYNGRSYKSQNNALVCNAETILDAKRIDILTSLSLDKWNRTIYIIFPDELRDNASNVKSYLDAIVPDGIEAVWNNDTTWLKIP